jgi:hypothetical protein
MAKATARRRRTYEYDHHYGVRLEPPSTPRQRVVSAGGKPSKPAQKARATKAAKKR